MFGDYQFTRSLSVNLPFPTLARRTFNNGPLFLAFEHADLVFELNDLLLLKLHRFDELRNDTEQLLNQRSLFRLRDIRQSQFHWRRTR